MDLLNKTETLTAIRAIAKSDGKLRDKVQTVALSALAHAGEHGDTGLMSKLVHAVNATTATQLRKYFLEFAPVQWNKTKGTFTKVKKGGAFRVADAFDVNWFDAIEDKKQAAAAYDSGKLLDSVGGRLITAMDAALEAGDTDTANKLADAFKELETLNLTVKVAA